MTGMKRKNIYLLILLMMLILAPLKVNALPICTASKIQEYIDLANKVVFKYEYVKDDDGYYFLIKASNVDKKLVIIYNKEEYTGLGEGGSITFGNHFEDNQTYRFKIVVSPGLTCSDETATSRIVKIPKFNIYSETDLCLEYEEAPMCGRYYNGNFANYEEFQATLLKYIEKLKNSGINQYKDERNIFQKFIDFYVDHIEISVAITLILIALLTYYVIRKLIRRKQRVKL